MTVIDIGLMALAEEQSVIGRSVKACSNHSLPIKWAEWRWRTSE